MSKKITIFTTPGCIYCVKAKEFFKQNNISYAEKDVSVDDRAREVMIEKSGQMGVPVIDIDGKIIVGFNEEELLKCMM